MGIHGHSCSAAGPSATLAIANYMFIRAYSCSAAGEDQSVIVCGKKKAPCLSVAKET